MRHLFRALIVVGAALSAGCQDGGSSADTLPTPPASGASGTAVVRGSIIGRGTGTIPGDTLVGDPLAGVRVRLYRQAVSVTTCDSTGTTPVCTTHPSGGGDDVTLPDGTVMVGELAATVTTDAAGRFSANDLESWVYFLVADPPAGSAFRSGAVIDIWIGEGETTLSLLWLEPL